MKHVALCLLFAGSLVACGSIPSPQTETDQHKIAAVEQAAQRGGVRVIWISVPKKAPG
jgi:hypothetical protein